jgi:hypothetical protein
MLKPISTLPLVQRAEKEVATALSLTLERAPQGRVRGRLSAANRRGMHIFGKNIPQRFQHFSKGLFGFH